MVGALTAAQEDNLGLAGRDITGWRGRADVLSEVQTPLVGLQQRKWVIGGDPGCVSNWVITIQQGSKLGVSAGRAGERRKALFQRCSVSLDDLAQVEVE